MKIKIIDRYIYSSLILPSIFGISIFTFILMLNVVMEVMERLFASDLPFISIIDYLLYAVPGILVHTNGGISWSNACLWGIIRNK